MTKITYIPGEIANAAIDEQGNRKPVTRTHHIFDDAKNKNQAEVNADIDNALALHQSEINALDGGNYVSVDTYSELPSTGSIDTIYRVCNWDGSANDGEGTVDGTVYSQYAWDSTNSEYKLLCVRTQIGEVFDISLWNAVGGVLATYDDLADALGVSGANVPAGIRKGGMSVKFVQSSDNKYVQFRYMSSSTAVADFINVANWQGVDDEPTAGSDNLVKSGGVHSSLLDTQRELQEELNRAVESITPIEITGDVTNAPDEEDLTSVNVDGTDVLKFKDKAYNPLTYSGMGRKILRKNIVDGVNTLTQSMMQVTNTIYVIQYDFDLGGETVTIPENSILEFDGGTFSNGSIIFNDTIIENIEGICDITLSWGGTIRGMHCISYSMFGAKLDGTNDDYNYVKKCHELANIFGFDVFQNYGTINLDGHYETDDRIIVKTNTDISRCTILVTDNTKGSNLYYIKDDFDLIDYSSIIRNNKSEFSMNADKIPSLSADQYSEHFYMAHGTRVLGGRPNGSGTSDPYYNTDCFTISSYGAFTCAPLYCDFTQDEDSANDRELTLYGKPISTNKITFKAPRININKAQWASPWYSPVFYIDRNNLVLELPETIDIDNYPTSGANTNLSIFIVENAYNITVKDGYNKNTGYLIGETLNSSNYIIRFTCCDRINIKNVFLYRGWGAMNTEFCKDVSLTDSIINRFDNHFGLGNLTANNVTVVGCNNCFNIGYGCGNIVLSNIKWMFNKTSSTNGYGFINFRKDIRLLYKGSITADNCYIKANGVDDLYLIYAFDQYGRDPLTYIEANNVNKVRISNLYIDESSTINNLYFLGYYYAAQSLNTIIKNLEFFNINTPLSGKLLFTSEGQTSQRLTIERLCLENCNIPNITKDNNVVAIINTVNVNNSDIRNITWLNNANNIIFKAINSIVRHSNIWNNAVASYINCDVIVDEITGGTTLQLYLKGSQFINCKFIPRPNGESEISIFTINVTTADDNSLMIACRLGTGMTIQYNRIQQILKYFRKLDNDIVDVYLSGDAGSNGLTLFSNSRKSPVFSKNYKWYRMDGSLASIPRNGTFGDLTANTISPDDIYEGFEYFCTSGASIDGGTTEKKNIPIFYTYNSGWVDANGNSVVAYQSPS